MVAVKVIMVVLLESRTSSLRSLLRMLARSCPTAGQKERRRKGTIMVLDEGGNLSASSLSRQQHDILNFASCPGSRILEFACM